MDFNCSKSFKPRLFMKKIISIFSFTLLCVAWVISSCNDNVSMLDTMNSLETKSVEHMSDTVFLGFEGDLNAPKIIWGNMDIYASAYDRMARKLCFKNNRIEWECSSAEEMHISQNIYDYVIGMWTYHNSQLESGDYFLIVEDTYYKIVSNKKKIMSSISSLTPPCTLIEGDHEYNMLVCCELEYKIYSGWLADYVNPSSLRPDGWGGWYLQGIV